MARRAVLAVALTWLPLLFLSAVQGLALGKDVPIPFLQDFAVNVRLLIALPLLIISEVAIDHRLRTAVNHFLKSGLVTETTLPAFEGAIERVTRLRDHLLPEIVMLVLAYLTSYFQGSDAPIGAIPSWHLSPTSSPDTLSYAGWWFTSISLPVYRFLLFRWVWRMYLWAYFLRCVSKMKLVLIPTHPDMAAGLSFLSGAQQRLGPIAFAIGAVVAGQLGNAIAYSGATVAGLKYVILAYCVCATLILVAPLLLLMSCAGPSQTKGTARLWSAGGQLHAGLRCQVGPRASARRRDAAGKFRHTVPRRPGEQLRHRATDASGAYRQEHTCQPGPYCRTAHGSCAGVWNADRSTAWNSPEVNRLGLPTNYS